MYLFTILEAEGSLKLVLLAESKCQLGYNPSDGSRGESIHVYFSFWSLWTDIGGGGRAGPYN